MSTITEHSDDTSADPVALKRPRRQFRRRAVPIGAALLVVMLIGLGVGLTPITLMAPVGEQTPSPAWDHLRAATPSAIEIEQVGPGSVLMEVPALAFPELFDVNGVSTLGPFTFDQASAQFVSTEPGAMVLDGTLADVTLTFEQSTEPADVRVTRVDERTGHQLELYLEPEQLQNPIFVPSSTTDASRTRLYLFHGGHVPPGGSASIGDRLITSEAGQFSAWDALGPAVLAAGRGWLIVGLGAALTAAFWAVGRVLLAMSAATSPPPAVALALGFGGFACTLNALSYVLPMRAVVPIVLVLVAGLVAWTLSPRGSASRHAVVKDVRGLGPGMLCTLPAVIIGFFPVYYWGTWFAGTYKPDLLEYTTLASIMRRASLLDIRSLENPGLYGNVTSEAGFVWRSIDTATSSFLSTAFGTRAVAAFVILAIALFMCFGVAVADLARAKLRGRYLVAALLVLNPVLLALFVDNYLSQFYFGALIPVFIVALRYAIESRGSARGATWALAAIAGVMIAAYPYFFIVVAAAATLAVVVSPSTRPAVRRLGISVIWKTVVCVNLAFLTVVRYGETRKFEEGLDAIARNFLIGQWNGFEAGQMMSGLRAYQWRTAIPDAGLHRSVRLVVDVAEWASSPNGIWVAAGCIALVVLVLAIDWRKTLLALDGRVVAFVLAGWILFAAAYFVRDRPYIFLKAGWTAGVLVPCLIAVSRWRPRFKGAALGALGLLAVMWSVTSLADRAYWMTSLSSTMDRGLHVSVVPDLARLDAVVDDLPNEVAVVPGDTLLGADRDRILTTHAVALLRDAHKECVNCTGTFLPPPLPCSETPDAVVVIGNSGEESWCDLPLVERGVFLEVYSRPAT